MNDARYTKGDAASQAKASVPSRQLIVGLLRSVGKDWKTVLIITAGIVLIGEALLPEDHKLRPANLYAAFSGDTQAGIHDRMRRVDAKYNVLEHDLISKIDRETTAVTKAIEARIYDREKRIDAVDRHQMPTLITNVLGEIACQSANIERGRIIGKCAETEQFRRDIMAERKALIGNEGLLFSDEDLLSRIGLPADYMQTLEK